ncbi:hypothetical protein EUGRSUZ_F03579 [Eucalyptus grandis]|uniref:Uncharacterized protein n=2 Tax=Eucalyptus grandis TaxID=71139 RepID=A0ACC3KP67_EUCGR|nr:hypothetical protein EUGRSUZ_F03579 [Eucalyptus grandis]
MAAASCPSRPVSKPADGFSFGTSPKTPNQFLGRPGCKNLSFASNYAGKVKVCTSRKLTVQARYDYDFWLPAISHVVNGNSFAPKQPLPKRGLKCYGTRE